MSSQATLGYGTLFQRGNGDGPPQTFSNVTESAEINPPESEAEDVKVTHLTSPGRRHEYIQGMSEAGEASVGMNWLPGDPMQDHNTGLLADKNSGTVKDWRIVLPNGLLTWEFSGYVKSFKPDAIQASEALRATVVIKVTGAETFS